MRSLHTLVAIATVTSSPATHVPARADSGAFSIFELQHRVGAESWTARPADAGNGKVIAASRLFTYIGSTVRLTESVSRGADGSPLALSAHGATSSASAQTRAFVHTIGRDTISLEQYTREGNRITGTWLTTYGAMTVHDYVLVLRPDGLLDSAWVSVWRLSGGAPSVATFAVRSDTTLGTVTNGAETVKFGGPGNAFLVLGQTVAMWDVVLRHQRAIHADTAVVPTVNAFGGQFARIRPVINGDSAVLVNYRLAIDAEGGVVSGVGRIGPAIVRRIQRVDHVDLPRALRTFVDAPATVDPSLVGYTSRDTARGTVDGAVIIVDYSRPWLSGRDPFAGRGILGDTLWRTGNFAATQITLPVDLTAGGVKVPAGRYSLWTRVSRANGSSRYSLVFNTQTGIYGTDHDAAKDLTSAPLDVRSNDATVDPFTISIEGTRAESRIVFRWARMELSATLVVR